MAVYLAFVLIILTMHEDAYNVLLNQFKIRI